MELSECLRRRAMVRSYTSEPVAPESRDRILGSALSSPSAGNSQGIQLVVVEAEADRHRLAALARESEYVARGFKPWLSVAPLHLVLAVSEGVYRQRYAAPDKSSSTAMDSTIPYWWLDAGAALMSILLTTVDEGLAAGFLGAHALEGLAGVVGLPVDVHAVGLVTVGHQSQTASRGGSRRRQQQSTQIHWGQWSNSS